MTERSWDLDGGYRIVLGVAPERRDALEQLWTTEASVPAEKVEQRLSQVLLLALDPSDQVAGVSTAYLGPYEPLAADLWYYRAFVGQAHRLGSLALMLARIGRDVLVERYVSGEDRRGLGVLYAVQNAGLLRAGTGPLSRFNAFAHWPAVDFWFMRETSAGYHIRVHYFPGVHAPEPPEPSRAGAG